MQYLSIHRNSSKSIKYGDSHPFALYENQHFCRGYRFSNVVKIVLFISDVQHYIPIKLCKTSGSPRLFKIKGTLKSEDIRLNKKYLWDTARNKLE